MPIGFHCEYPTFTACMNANRDKRDPGAWCGWLKKKTEKKCGGPLASMRLPDDLASPGAALSSRHEWELRAISLADEAVADFLVQVESSAREALSGAVVLAAGKYPNPFSKAGVREIWRKLTRRHPVLEELPENELADAAYERTASILSTTSVPFADAPPVSDQLATTLVYESEENDWQARTARASRTYATRLYNETVVARLSFEGYTSKRWVARMDDHTRHSHREADGQVVPIEANFRVGASMLLHPGDETGPAGEVYNCRCVVVAG